MDAEAPGESSKDLLIHSKFWKAKRGSQHSLAEGGQPELKRLTPLTSAPDHPFHSRSPRRALSSSPLPGRAAGAEQAPAILASSHLLTSPQTPVAFHSEVFRFDSTDRERYLCNAISEEEEVFSPALSPSSSTRSYDLVLDSPSITISSLHLGVGGTRLGTADSSPPRTTAPPMDSQNHLTLSRAHAVAMVTTTLDSGATIFGLPSSPISPITPNTPLSPSPLFSDQIFQQGLLAELYRRRCHSDSELPLTPEACKSEPTDLSVKRSHPKLATRLKRSIPHPLKIQTKGGSLESDQSSPQDSPLDLSVKGSLGSTESLSSRLLPTTPTSTTFSPAVVRGDIASPSTRNSVALRYNLDVSPVVETMPPGADMAFVCPMCGQMFSLHDRLAKHMASRHKSKPHDPNKSYPCDICHRSFARSDMLTRHMRLHTGVKPYTCRVCGQVFSRSDHLSTHQRTHTGEKPYKCPQCPYSACRRDMITRHLRTHSRNSSSSGEHTPSSASLTAAADPSGVGDLDRPIKMEAMPFYSRPPSSASSFAPDSPSGSSSASALNLSSLSVHSPTSPSQSLQE